MNKEDMSIKVVLFDVDGVLILGGPFSEHLARDYGITREVTASFFRGQFQECLVGKADLKEHWPPISISGAGKAPLTIF